MFKLSLVLCLLLGTQINVIQAHQQVLAFAKLGNDSSLKSQRNNTIGTKNNNLPDDDDNPEEGNLLEGDLLTPPYELGRYSILKTVSSWPAGLVPYQLSDHYTQEEKKILDYAFKRFAAKTCIRFYPRKTERDYIAIVKPTEGCASHVGRIGGKQTLNLGANCFRHGTIMHELMHVLGFLHEQNSSDRDEYVEIIYKNVIPGNEINFEKFPKKETTNLGIPYDYGSIMHYRANAFSDNGKPTIVALKKLPEGVKMGQRKGFSRYDLKRINQRYKCDESNLYRKVRAILS